MEYHYDEQGDTLTVNFGEAAVAIVDDDPEHAGVIMEYTTDKKLVNFKLLGASKRVGNPRKVKFVYGENGTVSQFARFFHPLEIELYRVRDFFVKWFRIRKIGVVTVVSRYGKNDARSDAMMIYFGRSVYDGSIDDRYGMTWDEGIDGRLYSLEIIHGFKCIQDRSQISFMRPRK